MIGKAGLKFIFKQDWNSSQDCEHFGFYIFRKTILQLSNEDINDAYHKQKYNATMLNIQYHSTAFGFPLPGSNLFPISIHMKVGHSHRSEIIFV